MNAPLEKIEPATRVIPAIDVLAIRAQIRAFLWWHHQIELDEAVDELQAYAERSGLVREIGQDRVQEIMAAPFARLRAMANGDECEAPQDESDVNDLDVESDSDFRRGVDEIVRRLELADPRDRWKHTGEPPPEPAKPTAPAAKQTYSAAQSTIDAFAYVVSLNDADYLARWLANHPADAPELFKIWKGKQC